MKLVHLRPLYYQWIFFHLFTVSWCSKSRTPRSFFSLIFSEIFPLTLENIGKYQCPALQGGGRGRLLMAREAAHSQSSSSWYHPLQSPRLARSTMLMLYLDRSQHSNFRPSCRMHVTIFPWHVGHIRFSGFGCVGAGAGIGISSIFGKSTSFNCFGCTCKSTSEPVTFSESNSFQKSSIGVDSQLLSRYSWYAWSAIIRSSSSSILSSGLDNIFSAFRHPRPSLSP